MRELLFVYGSLRPGTGHAWSVWMMRHAQRVVPATVSGKLYLLGAYPGLRLGGPDPRPVEGELIELRTSGLFWRLLDGYEDCRPDDAASRFTRVLTLVHERTPGRRARRAWAYCHAGSVDHLRHIPTGSFSGRRQVHSEKRRRAG